MPKTANPIIKAMTIVLRFDFASLPHWNNRNTIPFVYDKFYSVPQNDERLNALSKQKIDLSSLEWIDFSVLNNLTDMPKNIF